jgi:hypothetical protein
MLKIFCALTGDDFKLASVETPASRKKISVLGSVMLIPVLMWFIIGSSTAYSMFESGVSVSVIIGIIAGIIILILERAIVMSGHNKWITRFRIAIGFIIASLGAIFMDELIFEKDIKQQQFKERSVLIDAGRTKIDSIYKPRAEALQATLSSTRQSWMTTAEEARKEADGTGGSGNKGVSKITELKLEQAQVLKMELDKLEAEVQALNVAWSQEIEDSESKIENNLHGKSILARIKSLFKLVLKDPVAFITYVFFTFFLFSLEFIVIIMKHSLPETNYERRIAAMEQVGKRRLERLIEAGDRSYDPGDSSEQVRRMEVELRKPLPTLFKAS